MKVHLLRSRELNALTFGNVLNLLRQFKGPCDFLSAEPESLLNELQYGHSDWLEEAAPMSATKEFKEEELLLTPPQLGHYQTWEHFFAVCSSYRTQENLPAEDHIFLLTEFGNDRNWFGAVGPSKRDYFIQTSGWSYYFGTQVDERFPIAYEVVIWLIRHLMSDDYEGILHAVHRETRGCGNDFCHNKKDIILKMRTADFCPQCISTLSQRNVPPSLLSQLFSIMEGIRSGMIFRERIAIIRNPSRLEVRGYTYRIFLTDLGNLELRFNPKERAIYLFFLNHPEGVHLTALRDFRAEILGYYRRFSAQDESLEIERALDRLLNPLDNDIHVVLSRIKRKLKEAVGAALLPSYVIDGPHGGEKRILINRDFVVYSNEF
jgi:hypothetical protein